MRTMLPVAPDHLLPDEDAGAYEVFREELLAELLPKGAFQLRVAENIVNVEWGILRHRRLNAALLRTEFKKQAAGATQKGIPGPSRYAMDDWESVEHGNLLLKGDEQAAAEIADAGVTLSEITAAAHHALADAVAYHEGRLADLERRRRHLMSDLERLQAWAARHDSVPDAEVVE